MSRDEVWTAAVAATAVLVAVGLTLVVTAWLRGDGDEPEATATASPTTGVSGTDGTGAPDVADPDPSAAPSPAGLPCTVAPTPSPPASDEAPRPIAFHVGALEGADLDAATSVDLGPDGRVYVSQQDGLIVALTVERRGPGDFVVVAREDIDLVQHLPNHDDEGRPQAEVAGRLVTGLLVGGTAEAPCLYVSSSDPRIGGGPAATDLGGDTNSGVVSVLVRDAAGWQRRDLVRGLPRSREAHATNGLELDPATGTLYVAQGGNTNAGLPSPEFADLPEYALSAAILSVDLTALGPLPHDLGTLARPPGAAPFGGAAGEHQALLDVEGPVRVHSPGWRNPYDVELAATGRLYSFDNSAAADWGVPPAGDDCATLAAVGFHGTDALREVVAGGYAGHPNPARGTGRAVVGGAADPRQCRSERGDGARDVLATAPASTNGLVEYRASAFGGALQGDLLAAEFSDRIVRLDLDDRGRVVGQEPLVASFGGQPLDVTAQADDEPHPGTVWIAVWRRFSTESSVIVLEPDDRGPDDRRGP